MNLTDLRKLAEATYQTGFATENTLAMTVAAAPVATLFKSETAI